MTSKMIFRFPVSAVIVCVCVNMCRCDWRAEDREPKVLILGAGISGLSAAKTLEEAGHSNFIVLEGSDRIGGRIYSTRLSEHTVELGAMWIYGKGSNPIYRLVQKYNISFNDNYQDSVTIRDTSGANVTKMANERQTIIYNALANLEKDGKTARDNSTDDFSVMSNLRYHDWKPQSEIDDVIEIFNVDFEFGVPPSHLSGKHVHWDAPFDSFQSEDMPAVTDQGGFESLVHKLKDELVRNKSASERFLFNQIVTQVNQTSNGVSVLTLDGTLYRADYVIVTFSLGVLQSGDINFIPGFPECKRIAINKFGMSHFTHIYLQFPYVFWDDTLYILYASEDRGKYSTWVNLNHFHPDSNILQLSVWAEESRRIERMDDQMIVDDLLRTLRVMYPNNIIPFPDNFSISRWTYDPLYYGAYSYWPTGFTMDNMADMVAPFGRVYFAGEHLDPVQYSYVHAAYESGNRTAFNLLECLQDLESCPSDADDTFDCSKTQLLGQETFCVHVSAVGLIYMHRYDLFGWVFYISAVLTVFMI